MKKIHKYKKILESINIQEENEPLVIIELIMPRAPSTLTAINATSKQSSLSPHPTFTVFPSSTRVH